MENNEKVICRAKFKSSFMSFISVIVTVAVGIAACIVANKVAINKESKKYHGYIYHVNEQSDNKGIFTYTHKETETEDNSSKNQFFNVSREGKWVYVFGIKLHYRLDYSGKQNIYQCDVEPDWKKTHGSYNIKYGTWSGPTGDVVRTEDVNSVEKNKTYVAGIVALCVAGLVLIILIFLAIKPFIISKRCSLELSEEQVSGQLKKIFSKKHLQMPIDHIDSVMTAKSFMDKLRGGETLLISSNSGIIKFHYVHNADEFAQAAMKRIDEVKKSAPVPQAAPVQSVSGSDVVEKISSLKQMLDSGLITQVEFDQKKQELLSKM